MCIRDRCNENDGETVVDGIHRAVVTPKETTQIVCTEVPGTHAFPLTLKKMDQELSEPSAVRGNMSLQGGVFELSYYMNVNGETEDSPCRRWYFYTDADGKLDYEVIEALDVKFFNEQMTDLPAGKEVELPVFDFVSGKRKFNGDYLKLGEDDVLVIEGIHCLNDKMSYSLSLIHI